MPPLTRFTPDHVAQIAIQILRECLDSPHGIVVKIEVDGDMASPALRAKQILYRHKNENMDFADIEIHLGLDDPDTELWLTKRALL